MKTNRNLYVLALGVFGIATTEFGVIGILPQLADAFQVSIEKAGWLLSAFAIVVAVSGPFLMLFLSSFDRKKLMVSALFIFMISNVVSAFAGSFVVLLAARILPAFFHPVYWSIALTAAARYVPENESAKAVSMVFGGFTIASIIGVPLATLSADLFGWQVSFLLSAAINAISLLGLILLLSPIPKAEAAQSCPKLLLLKNPALLINLLLAFLLITSMYSTYGYMADYLKSVTRMDGKEISAMLFLFGITGVQGNRLAGKFMGRNPDKTIWIFIVSLVLVHCLLFAFGNAFLPIVFLVAIWGLVHTAGFVISNIIVVSAGKESPEFINSIFTSCGNFAVSAGASLGGFWIACFGIREIVWSSVLCLAMSLIVFFIKKKIRTA